MGRDRSTRPISSPSQTLPATGAEVGACAGSATGEQIAINVGISPESVSRILRRLGLNRLRIPQPAEQVRRYEREHLDVLIWIDIKKPRKFNRVGNHIGADRTGQSSLGARGERHGWKYGRLYRRCLADCLQRAGE
ncbi:hypothetical protein [Bradyrhizobium sacchari]|uniref:hypothetical protein n=1 Tax=Bradyrhizobium sacchari TaxID=1399419 RepID=UPI0010A9624A|nr:hypothetical protein [Bradyrhizobium sacchari]